MLTTKYYNIFILKGNIDNKRYFFPFLVINIGNLMIPTVAIGAALGATGLILGAKGAALTLSSGYF